MGRGFGVVLALVLLSGGQVWAREPVPPAQIRLPLVADLAHRDTVTHELPSGRLLSPVGLLQDTPNFPAQVVGHGDWVAVLANGATDIQTITLYDRASLAPLAQFRAHKGGITRTGDSAVQSVRAAPSITAGVPVTERAGQSLYQGLNVGPDGTLYAAGGVSDNVLALRYRRGRLRVVNSYSLHGQPFPRNQYPYQYQGDQEEPRRFYPDSVAVSGGHLYVTGLLSNSLARIDLRTGETRYVNVGPMPFAVAAVDDGRRLLVSNWGADHVTVVDAGRLRVLGRISLLDLPQAEPQAGVHPTAIAAVPGTARAFVLSANNDRLAEIDTRKLRLLRSVSLAPYPDAPPGSYPDGIHLTGDRLFIANAGNNSLTVLDGKTLRPLGSIPTAWYPTAVWGTRGSVYVVCAKGLGSGPNLQKQWVGSMMRGVLQKLDWPALQPQLAELGRVTLHDNGFTATQRAARRQREAGTVAWLRRHIRHVVFILRENKTFDEDLGRYARAGAWADPHLALYGPRELPNLFALADRYALLTNFYVDGEVTAQAHQWTTGASDSDFIQRTWPIYYSKRGLIPNPGWTQALRPHAPGAKNPYAIYADLSSLGHFSNPWIAYPYRLYLFDKLAAHGVSFANFGEFLSRDRQGRVPERLRTASDTDYPAWDLDVLDSERARRFQDWAERRIARDDFPAFTYIWLPDDHTAGLRPCALTPDYYVADNDAATGRILDFLSHSKLWKHTLVILTEDDAQSGADHVSAHRSFALLMSPWIRRGALVATHYSQIDLLRTEEAILGLPPMSQWDGNARVIQGIWQDTPDPEPFNARPMQVAKARNACAKAPALSQAQRYGPTDLLKVGGQEQFRQVWTAKYGPRGYARVMDYLNRLAAGKQASLNAFLAHGEAGDDDD